MGFNRSCNRPSCIISIDSSDMCCNVRSIINSETYEVDGLKKLKKIMKTLKGTVYFELLNRELRYWRAEQRIRLYKEIRDRYQKNVPGEYTLSEIGKIFGLTRERVRQIEATSLKKLKHPSFGKKTKSLAIYMDGCYNTAF